MRARALLVGALVAGGLSACGGGGDGPDPWTLEVSGRASLVRDGSTRTLDGGEHKVEDGDRVEVVSGRAVLTLPDDASLELREGAGAADDSVLRVGDVPELLDGEMLLVGAGDGASAVAGAATIGVEDGALRVRRGASVTVGAYGGSPRLEANGRELSTFRALRQATVTDSGVLPRELQPVTFDADAPDPWDVRFLGDAIDLDTQITLRQSAVARDAERSDLGPIVADLAGGAPVDATRSVGETVVGAAIVRAAATDADVDERWRDVFSFRDDGAAWGVVALDQQAARADVLAALDGVVGRLVQRFGGVAAGQTGGGADIAVAAPVGPGGQVSPPPSSDDGSGSPSTPPTTQPPSAGPLPLPTLPPDDEPLLPLPDLPIIDDDDGTEPEPPPPGGSGSVGGTVDDVVDEVEDAVDDVPVVDDVVDVVDDLIEDPGDVLDQVTDGLLGG